MTTEHLTAGQSNAASPTASKEHAAPAPSRLNTVTATPDAAADSHADMSAASPAVSKTVAKEVEPISSLGMDTAAPNDPAADTTPDAEMELVGDAPVLDSDTGVADTAYLSNEARVVNAVNASPAMVEPGRTSRGGRTLKQPASLIPAEPAAAEKVLIVPVGAGVQLGQIAVVEESFKRRTGMDEILRSLHRVVFPGYPVKKRDVKAHLREWSGIAAEETGGTNTHEVYETKLGHWPIIGLKEVCEMFGLEKSGNKEVLVTRISGFLIKPFDSGARTIAEKKLARQKRRSSTNSTKKGQRKSKSSATRKRKSASDESDNDNNSTDDDKDDDDESADDADNDDGEYKDNNTPKSSSVTKKRKESRASSASATNRSTTSVSPKKLKTSKAPARSSPSKPLLSKAEVSDSESEGDAQVNSTDKGKNEIAVDEKTPQDDVALPVLKEKKQPSTVHAPSDEQLGDEIKRYIGAADLAAITKNTVRQHLQHNFNDQVLAARSGDAQAAELWWRERKDYIHSVIDETLAAL